MIQNNALWCAFDLWCLLLHLRVYRMQQLKVDDDVTASWSVSNLAPRFAFPKATFAFLLK